MSVTNGSTTFKNKKKKLEQIKEEVEDLMASDLE